MAAHTPEARTPPPREVGFNGLGRIAESYDVLHNIAHLSAARQQANVHPASHNSAVRAVFQAAEVAVLNLTRLSDRASCQLARGDAKRAFVLVRWIRGLHDILRRLGSTTVALQIQHGRGPASPASEDAPAVMGIRSSPAFQRYVEAVRCLDNSTLGYFSAHAPDALRTMLGEGTHDDLLYSLLHQLRLIAHDSCKWEVDLSAVSVEPGMPEYENAIGGKLLEAAVHDAMLSGETFYGEFVCLHQIPELLCAEVNDHIEAAIRYFRADELSPAIERIASGRALLTAVIESQRVMVDCLATAEYHRFRENLGPASGMHSLAIRQHMFRDLFTCLWNDLEAWVARGGAGVSGSVRSIVEHRHDSAPAWLRHALLDEAYRLHQLHEDWRHEHLHMPRNCLGSGGTRSMIGVPDGLETVMKMRDAANAQPALLRMHQAKGLRLGRAEDPGPLTGYHLGDGSLDHLLKCVTGEVTRDFFPEVQGKEFCPFRSRHPVRRP